MSSLNQYPTWIEWKSWWAWTNERAFSVLAWKFARRWTEGTFVDVLTVRSNWVRFETFVARATVRSHCVYAASIGTQFRHNLAFIDICNWISMWNCKCISYSCRNGVCWDVIHLCHHWWDLAKDTFVDIVENFAVDNAHILVPKLLPLNNSMMLW